MNQNPLRLDLADYAANVAAQILADLQVAVFVTQEMNIGNAECRTGGTLLSLTDLGNLTAQDGGVGSTGVPVGANAIADLYSSLRPLADGASRAKVDVVGVGGDYKNALDLHQNPSMNRSKTN